MALVVRENQGSQENVQAVHRIQKSLAIQATPKTPLAFWGT